MAVSKIPLAVMDLVQPAINQLASRLYVLTDGRAGSKEAQLGISDFYETSVVQFLYETMLASPRFHKWEIRIEKAYGKKRVDLWLRPASGGMAILIEAGFWYHGTASKINSDAKKLKAIHPSSKSSRLWVLGLVPDLQKEKDYNRAKRKDGRKESISKFPLDFRKILLRRIEKSLNGKRGLNRALVKYDEKLVRVYHVYRPSGLGDVLGVVLFRVKS